MDVVYRVLVRCWSGAGQVSFARERVNKFGCRVLINGRGVAKARRVVESRPHHQMRGSQGPRVGETGETGVIAGGEGQVGKATYLWMWLQSPRWLIPKVAQPQIPPSKSQKRAKLISVCALTQQDWKAKKTKGEWWRL